MRYGTRTDAGRRWMPHGERPTCRVKIGYDYGLLYTALCPYNGDLFAMFLPNMTAVCFDIFAQNLLKHTQKTTTLLLDRATCHTSYKPQEQEEGKLKLIFFPPACPELNPAERFFKELRKELKCRVFEEIEQIETKIKTLLQKYWDKPQLVVQIACFPYFNTQ